MPLLDPPAPPVRTIVAAAAADREALQALRATRWTTHTHAMAVSAAAFEQANACLEIDPIRRRGIPAVLDPGSLDVREAKEQSADPRDRADAAEMRREWPKAVMRVREVVNTASLHSWNPEVRFGWEHSGGAHPTPEPRDGLSPHGDTLARGILSFADAVPLGPLGFSLLCVHLGTAAGYRARTHQGHIRWAHKHMEDIRASAADPLNVTWWWRIPAGEPGAGRRRHDPWGTLAACDELDFAMQHTDPSSYPSRLPVTLAAITTPEDHLAALVLPPRALTPPLGFAIFNTPAPSPEKAEAAAAVAAWLTDAVGRLLAAGVTPTITTPTGTTVSLPSAAEAPVDVAAALAASIEAMTILDAVELDGITAFSGTGQRFGTHAGHLHTLALRHQGNVATTYAAEDFLGTIWRAWRDAAPRANLPGPPPRTAPISDVFAR